MQSSSVLTPQASTFSVGSEKYHSELASVFFSELSNLLDAVSKDSSDIYQKLDSTIALEDALDNNVINILLFLNERITFFYEKYNENYERFCQLLALLNGRISVHSSSVRRNNFVLCYKFLMEEIDSSLKNIHINDNQQKMIAYKRIRERFSSFHSRLIYFFDDIIIELNYLIRTNNQLQLKIPHNLSEPTNLENIDSSEDDLSFSPYSNLPIELKSTIYMQGLESLSNPIAIINYLLKISRIDSFHYALVLSEDTSKFLKKHPCSEAIARLSFESIMHHDLNALKLAIRLGANVNTCRAIANQPIYFLFDESKESPVFIEALERALKNSPDKVVVATSLLHLAINQNWVSGVKLLLNDERIIIQQRVLQYGLNFYSSHPPTLFLSSLLTNCMVSRDLNATSLMHLAVSVNNLTLVKLLRKKGFSIQLKSNKETPIMLAAKLGHYEIIHYLEKANWPNLQPPAYDDILVIAIKNNRYETVEKLIIELGMKPYGFKPLANANTASMAKLLIQNGADATAKNPSQNTYLHLAMNASYTHTETSIDLISYLINFHSTIPVNQYGCTPLHLLCTAPSHRNIITIINILLTHFGDSILEIKNNKGQTALEVAWHFENKYALKRLIELNANSDVIPTLPTTSFEKIIIFSSIKENIIYNADDPILEGVAEHLIRTSDNIYHLTPTDKDLKVLIEIKNKNKAFIQALTQQKDILLEKFTGSYLTQKKLDVIDNLITQINQDLTLDFHIHIQDWVKNAKENPLVVLAEHRRKEGFLSSFSPLYHTDSIKFLMRFTQDKKFILAQKTVNSRLTPIYQS